MSESQRAANGATNTETALTTAKPENSAMAIHAHSIPMPVDNLLAGQVCATEPQTPAMAGI